MLENKFFFFFGELYFIIWLLKFNILCRVLWILYMVVNFCVLFFKFFIRVGYFFENYLGKVMNIIGDCILYDLMFEECIVL